MSEKDADYEAYQAALADQRAEAAREWDQDTVDEAAVLGAAIEELEGSQVGPIEIEGREDYIRGDDGHDYVRGETACLRGNDIVGAIAQFGSSRGKKLKVQGQGAGFVVKHLPGGRSFTAVKVRSAFSNKDTVANARAVAKNAKIVANSLKNFKSSRHGVVGVDWVDILGELEPGFDEIIGTGADSVARPEAYELHKIFDDVLGAPRRRHRLPTDEQVRTLARELDRSADKLNKLADNHENKANAEQVRIQRATQAVRGRLFGGRKRVVGDDDGGGGGGDDLFTSAVYDVLGHAKFFLGEDGDVPADAAQGSADLPPGPPDYGVSPAPKTAPPRNPDEYIPDPGPETDQTIYDSSKSPLPMGIVWFDDSRSFPTDGVGSYNRYYGPGRGSPNGGSGLYWFGEGTWIDRYKPDELKSKYDDNKVPGESLSAYLHSPSAVGVFTPLVGSPSGWTNGLRFDVGSGGWFWYWDTAAKNAPWATAADDLVRFSKALVDHATALEEARTEYLQAAATAKKNAADAKAQADAWAKEQVEIQHKQERDTAAQGAAEAEAERLRTQTEAQLESQRAQAELEQQKQQAQLEAAAQQLQIDTQRAELPAYQQWLQQQQPGQGGPFEDLDQQEEGDEFGEPQMDSSELDMAASAAPRPDTGDWE